MKKLQFGLLGLVMLALPQFANAQSFTATNAYTAKFLCGLAPGGDSNGLGVVLGHYNTVINALATKNNQPIAYRATATRTNLETSTGVVSDFSSRSNLDRDGALGIACNQIKSLLGVSGDPGFIEGFVIIYSNAPLLVTDVLTGEPDKSTGVSVLQVYQVTDRTVNMSVKPGN
jgi:hypothetical protein